MRTEDQQLVARETLKTLTRTFIEHEGYISDKWEHYLGIYEMALARFVMSGQPIRLLEVGVQNGGSLQVWSKYLPEGSTIVGIDIDPACEGLTLGSNVSIGTANAADPAAIDRVLANAEFDIIIDDGSHRSEHVISTFRACFSRLKPGGLYIVEDMHASYFSSYGGGFRLPGSSMEWFKDLADTLNVDHFEKDATEKISRAELDWLEGLGRQIARITFVDSMVLIDKFASEKRVPYRRVMTGRDARVVDCAAQIIPGLPDQELRTLVLPPSTAASFAPALLNAMAATREEIGSLRSSLSHIESQREIAAATVAQATARAERAQADAAEATARAKRAEAEKTEAEARARTAENARRKAIAAKSESELRAALFQQKADKAHAVLAGVIRERDAVLQSTAWKVTWPLRFAGSHLPASAVRVLRGGLEFMWWSATLQLRRKLKERRTRPCSPMGATDPKSIALSPSSAEAITVALGDDQSAVTALRPLRDSLWSVSTKEPITLPRLNDSKPRVLFIEDHLPTPSLGAGFGRSEIIVRALLDTTDLDIFVRSRRDEDEMLSSHYKGIEITYGPNPALLELRLSSRRYDAVYVCRSPNLACYEQVLRTWKQGGGCIIFDTEAIAAVREVAFTDRVESYVAITGSARFSRLVEEELRPAEIADAIVAVNKLEAGILRQQLDRPVITLGHYLSVRPLDRPITDRSGLLFVGALHDAETPNYESLVWFLDHVWPRIRAERPEETLRIAGYLRHGVPLGPLQREGVSCLGPISDLTAEFARARAFIAPTRFAAGIPLKVYEAFSYGLPVVGSRLISEQVRDDIDGFGGLVPATVRDDGQEFARACLELLQNGTLWLEKHDAALAYVKSLCAPSRLQKAINALASDIRKRSFGTINSGTYLATSARDKTIDLNQWREEITLDE